MSQNSNNLAATAAGAAGAAGSMLLLKLFYPSPSVTGQKLIKEQQQRKKNGDEKTVLQEIDEENDEAYGKGYETPTGKESSPTAPLTATSPTESTISTLLTVDTSSTVLNNNNSGIARSRAKKREKRTSFVDDDTTSLLSLPPIYSHKNEAVDTSEEEEEDYFNGFDSDSDISYGDDEGVTKSIQNFRQSSANNYNYAMEDNVSCFSNSTSSMMMESERDIRRLNARQARRGQRGQRGRHQRVIGGVLIRSDSFNSMEEFLQSNNNNHNSQIVTGEVVSHYGLYQNYHQRQQQPQKSQCIYLDWNDTTPVDPSVLKAMMPFLTQHFGNPSSTHAYGLLPRVAVNKARRAILSLLYPNWKQVRQRQRQLSPYPRGETGSNTSVSSEVVDEKSIVFTGCGTEADNLAIRLALDSVEFADRERGDGGWTDLKNKRKRHIVTSNVEHAAIHEYLKALEKKGECEVTYVAVDREGVVSTKDVIAAIRPNNETVLVTLMLANNESGALQPVREVSTYCQSKGILFHTDAAQAVGKVSVSLEDNDNDSLGSGVDMLTIVGHKMGAPKGVAALYIRPNCLKQFLKQENELQKSNENQSDKEKIRKEPSKLSSPLATASSPTNSISRNGVLLHGGGQENGIRGGTENVPYIVGLGQAARLLSSKATTATNSPTKVPLHTNTSSSSSPPTPKMPTVLSNFRQWEKNAVHMESLRNRLLGNLISGLGDDVVRTNGPRDSKSRLPNTLSVGFKEVNSAVLLERIQMHVACSAAFVCHADDGGISPVLKAMSVPEEYARGTVRLSVGPTTTAEDVDKAASIIITEAQRQINN